MKINIVNVIDSFSKINFGIWNSALSTCDELAGMGCSSWLIFPECDIIPKIDNVNFLPISNFSDSQIVSLITENCFSPIDTIIVTHGCWKFPTKFGYYFAKKGFKWIYNPHGMLEPWSLKQKWLKKIIYYNLFEFPFSKSCSTVRAVSQPEASRLSRKYKNIIWIPNGVKENGLNENTIYRNFNNGKTIFLFMARLHKKKGLMPLVRAWKSMDWNADSAELWIVGPDDGELKQFLSEIIGIESIKYKGSVYNDEKKHILSCSHFFVLPSFSEGFPTSVVEAMSFGLVPIISDGCNFPDVYSHNLGFRISTDVESIRKGLYLANNLSFDQFLFKSINNFKFIKENYTSKIVSEKQFKLYTELLRQ